MSRVTVLTALFSVIASVASAEDVLRSTQTEPAVIKAEIEPSEKAANFSNRWAGAYAGLNVSYSMLKDTAPAEGKGFVYGGFLGYNIAVTDNIVAGLEAGYTQLNVEFDDGSGVTAKSSFSARFRGGYATDRFFVYGLIGVENAVATAPFAPGFNFNDNALTLGAGVDVAVTDRLALGLEYTRTTYKEFDFPTFPLPVDVTMQKVQARLIFKFN